MKKIFTVILAVVLSISCSKEDREIQLTDQEKSIETYLKGVRDGGKQVVSNGGAYRVITTKIEGAKAIEQGDSVYFYYAGYIFASKGAGAFFATNRKEVAEAQKFNADLKIMAIRMGETKILSGLDSGLIGATEGEVCDILFSARYGYNNEVVYNVPKLSPLFFNIWIERVVKN